MAEELSRISKVTASEKAFELGITGIEGPFIGTVDLVAKLDGKPTVTDFENRVACEPAKCRPPLGLSCEGGICGTRDHGWSLLQAARHVVRVVRLPAGVSQR